PTGGCTTRECFRERAFGLPLRNAHPVKRKTRPFGFECRAGRRTRACSLARNSGLRRAEGVHRARRSAGGTSTGRVLPTRQRSYAKLIPDRKQKTRPEMV